MGVVNVPFEHKKTAVSFGIIFHEDTGQWTGSKENERKFYKAISADGIKQGIEQDNIPVQDETQTEPLLSKREWDKIIKTSKGSFNDLLIIVKAIHEYGMPEEEKQRIDILKLFSLKRPDDYPIHYQDMILYSENFKKRYPPQKVEKILLTYDIKGINLTKELKAVDMTPEDKALICFVLS